MKTNRLCRQGAWMGIVAVAAMLWGTPALAADAEGPLISLVRLAADRIDTVFRDVAASTRALGDEYRRLAAHPAPVTAQDKAVWIARSTTSGSTTGFRTWPEGTSAPAFQAAVPSFYSYGGTTVTGETVTHLRDFERALPIFRAAYHSFDFSWVYLTTADGMMLIYPYVPLDEAVNNEVPTRQVFYTAADFARKSVGWTAPYLDLVGAGLMITASYPIYAGDRLLGVASRDITLRQLSQTVLTHLTRRTSASAFIIDRRGLAIDASDTALEAEIERVNSEKKDAVLFYRSSAGLAKDANPDAEVSRFAWVNEVSERVLDKARQSGVSEVIDTAVDGRKVLAARIESTGWFIVLIEQP